MESTKNIISNRYFVIPKNQRGFSWTEKELEELKCDLELAVPKAHYLGPIIVTGDKSGDLKEDNYRPANKCILEDGQQRITAFFLLLRALEEQLISLNGGDPNTESEEIHSLLYYKKGGDKIRLQNDNPALQACFAHLMDGSQPRPDGPTAPMRALVKASSWCHGFAEKLDEPECLKWKNRLTHQALFILVDLDQAGVDRYLTFDAINSRGLPLSQFDKIKNFCILVLTVRGIGIAADDEWYEALKHLDTYDVGNRSMEEAFITELFSTFEDNRIGQDSVHDKFVERYKPLLSASDPLLEGELETFIRVWKYYAKSFGFIATGNRHPFYGRDCNKEAGVWLDRLDNMNLPTITRPILVAAHYRFPKTDFKEIARACEIYTFRVYAVIGRRTSFNVGGIINLANEILKNSKGIDYAINRICEWLCSFATIEKVVEKIGNGDVKYYFDPSVTGWGYCYYFLYEYEISRSPAGVSPLPWAKKKEDKRNTQEHILPQKHRDGGWWESEWPEELKAERFKHRLGNLVLTAGNSVLGRKPFPKKLKDPSSSYYFDHKSATNSEKEIRNFANAGKWDEGCILTREFEMIKFAVDRWSIPCCCDNGVIYLSDEFAEAGYASISVNETDCYSADSTEEEDEEGVDEISTEEDGEA